jgi:hypothetical protein
VLVITKASIPANGSGETRLLAGQLLVELHLLLGSFVLLLGFLLGLQHVLQVLLLLLLGLLIVPLLLALLLSFLLLEQAVLSASSASSVAVSSSVWSSNACTSPARAVNPIGICRCGWVPITSANRVSVAATASSAVTSIERRFMERVWLRPLCGG